MNSTCIDPSFTSLMTPMISSATVSCPFATDLQFRRSISSRTARAAHRLKRRRINPITPANFSIRASGQDRDSLSPHQVLGVPRSASIDDIKKAYRRLALKYHPDVNKEANAQEKFMRIKHAYNTIITSKSRNHSSQSESRAPQPQVQEDFYGFGDFFRDVQEEFRNWDAEKQEKPKSLWQELADIGEEFVEFLEKELNILDAEEEATSTEAATEANKESSIDEIEAALAQLKSEFGL